MLDVRLGADLVAALAVVGAPGARRRRRSAPLGRAGVGAGRRDRQRRRADGAPHRDLPPGGREPHRRQRAPDSRGGGAGAGRRGRRSRVRSARLLFPRRGRPGGGGDAHPRSGGRPAAAPLRLFAAGDPGAVADAPRGAGGRQPQSPPAGGADRGRARHRARPADLARRRQGDAGEERLRQGGLERRQRHHRGGGGRDAGASASTTAWSSTRSTSWTRWCWPTRPPSTSHRGRSTRRW